MTSQSKYKTHENAAENIVCQMAAILSREDKLNHVTSVAYIASFSNVSW